MALGCHFVACTRKNMFWIRHPQPVTSRRAVAELSVKRSAVAPMSTRLLIVERDEVREEARQALDPGDGSAKKPLAGKIV